MHHCKDQHFHYLQAYYPLSLLSPRSQRKLEIFNGAIRVTTQNPRDLDNEQLFQSIVNSNHVYSTRSLLHQASDSRDEEGTGMERNKLLCMHKNANPDEIRLSKVLLDKSMISRQGGDTSMISKGAPYIMVKSPREQQEESSRSSNILFQASSTNITSNPRLLQKDLSQAIQSWSYEQENISYMRNRHNMLPTAPIQGRQGSVRLETSPRNAPLPPPIAQLFNQSVKSIRNNKVTLTPSSTSTAAASHLTRKKHILHQSVVFKDQTALQNQSRNTAEVKLRRSMNVSEYTSKVAKK